MDKERINQILQLPIYKEGTLQKVYRDRGYIYKLIDASFFNVPPDVVANDINQYIDLCQNAKINIPNQIDVPFIVEGRNIVNRYSYEGIPLIDKMNLDNNFESLFLGLLSNVANGLENGLGVSSFHGQYTVNDDEVKLVDFFIPGVKESFLRYKKGEDALNYYLVHFSPNSVMVSCFTHYQQLFPCKNQEVDDIFINFMEHKNDVFPLVNRILEMPQIRLLTDGDTFLKKSGYTWLKVNKEMNIFESNHADEILKNVADDDLIINTRQQRPFLKEELISVINNFPK